MAGEHEKVTIHEPYKSPKKGMYQIEEVCDTVTHEYKPIFGRGVATAIIEGMRRQINAGPPPKEKTMKRSPGRFPHMFKNTGRFLRELKQKLVGDTWEIRAPSDRFEQSMPAKVFEQLLERFWLIVDLAEIQRSRRFQSAQAEAWRRSITVKPKQRAR